MKKNIKCSLLPDFIICGAMKSGTTTLHHILNSHKNVFIPNKEIYFFDIDDINQHPDFFVRKSQNKWNFYNYKKNFNNYLTWYKSFFEKARETDTIGEDSTTYLASENSASRIKNVLPNVNLIFLLRDPVERAYSHYRHLVESGEAIYNFENMLQYKPGNILERGFYKKQIKRFLNEFPKEQIKIILFEDFIDNLQHKINEICNFIGLEEFIDIEEVKSHENASKYPIFFRLQLLINRLFLKKPNFPKYLPNNTIESYNTFSIWFDKIFRKTSLFITDRFLTKSKKRIYNYLQKHTKPFSPAEIFEIIIKFLNLSTAKTYPPMKKSTREFLEKLYAKENEGISKLININVSKYWTYM